MLKIYHATGHEFCILHYEKFFIMTRGLTVFVLGLGLLSACKSAEDYLSEGQELSSAGNFKAALSVFEVALKRNPFLKDTYIQMGICHENLNQQDSALHVYMDLLRLYPDNTAAYYYSGICKYKQKKFDEAAAFFDKAIDSKGGFNSADTTSIQALIDLNKDNFQSESAEIDIPTREILYDRAMAYYKSGQIKNACADFANCVFQKYNTVTSHYMIGLCRRATGARPVPIRLKDL
jgi:tetratricopeptide (TPR) repeat protein